MVGYLIPNYLTPPADDPTHRDFLDPTPLSQQRAQGRGKQLWVAAITPGTTSTLLPAQNAVPSLSRADPACSRGRLRAIHGIARNLLHLGELDQVPNGCGPRLVQRNELTIWAHRAALSKAPHSTDA